MGVPGNANTLLLRTAAANGRYQVSKSLRFNSADSAYLSRTPASAGNRKTWTWSGWVKRSSIGSGSHALFGVTNSGASAVTHLVLEPDNLTVYDVLAPGYVALITTQVFRDPSAWYHIVWTCDTTQATASNRMKLYVNGTEITTFSTDNRSSFTQNADTSVNSTNQHSIGSRLPYTGAYFSGYLAEIHFIDGQALTPSSFAETDSTTGQWIPRQYSGSFGSQGWKLTFSDNSAATAAALGKDTSGNGLNWSPTNFSVTAGAGNDSLTDTPTSYGTDTGAGGEVRGNYCTLNPLDKNGNVTLKNGNLDADNNVSTWSGVRGTIGVATGKWYWEYTLTGPGYAMPGLAAASVSMGNYAGASANGYSMFSANGALYANGSYTGTTLSSFTTNDVFGVAFDADNGKLWFAKNGVWWSSGNPAAGTNPLFSSISSGTYFPTIAFDNTGGTNGGVANFGQRPFAYTAPSGFKCLSDTSLPTPVVAKPNTVMDVALYSGNSSTQSISGYNLSPDLVWIKTRGPVANNNFLFDAVRGATKYLISDLTSAEQTVANTLTSFDSGGFTTGSNNDTNASGRTFVAWMWDAGSSTVTNTQGSITSQVRANQNSGFSICTFTQPSSSSSFSWGHGLNVAPQLVFMKPTSSSGNWQVYHASTGAQYLWLNSTNAATGTGWSTVNSSVVTATATLWAGNFATVAYCFAPVAGYSSMGSYVGNGSSDGPAVWLGFRPRWILVKSTGVEAWEMIDAARDTYNVATKELLANSSAAESTIGGIDLLSNGFKIRNAGSGFNSSSQTYIYFAVAESPFQYARAR